MTFEGTYKLRSGEAVTVRTEGDTVYECGFSGRTWEPSTGDSRDSSPAYDLMYYVRYDSRKQEL